MVLKDKVITNPKATMTNNHKYYSSLQSCIINLMKQSEFLYVHGVYADGLPADVIPQYYEHLDSINHFLNENPIDQHSSFHTFWKENCKTIPIQATKIPGECMDSDLDAPTLDFVNKLEQFAFQLVKCIAKDGDSMNIYSTMNLFYYSMLKILKKMVEGDLQDLNVSS